MTILLQQLLEALGQFLVVVMIRITPVLTTHIFGPIGTKTSVRATLLSLVLLLSSALGPYSAAGEESGRESAPVDTVAYRDIPYVHREFELENDHVLRIWPGFVLGIEVRPGDVMTAQSPGRKS